MITLKNRFIFLFSLSGYFPSLRIASLVQRAGYTLPQFKIAFPLFLFFLFGAFMNCEAQTTIWQEDFNYEDGIASGTGTPSGITSWTADGYDRNENGIAVKDKKLTARRSANGNRYRWQTSSIDISGYTNVSISVDISGEGPMESSDYVIILYKLDNGSWQTFDSNGSLTNNNWSSVVASQAGLVGSSLFLRFDMYNSADNEYYYADNILVQGTPPCSAVGDPSIFGDDQWNVYAYNGDDIDLSGITYRGYYTEPSLTFDSRNRWSDSASPSNASGYQGCTVDYNYHTVVYKRTNFTCGTYQIDVAGQVTSAGHDDAARLYIDGSQVWEHIGCCDSHTNVWTGLLDSNSTVEFRVEEQGGGSYGALVFTSVGTSLGADFSANSTTVNAGASVSFSDLSSGGPNSYQWSFPGGSPSSSTSQNPTVTYNAGGTYDVSLTISDDCGEDTQTKTGYITVASVIPSVSLSINNSTMPENGGEAVVTATLSNTYSQPVTIYLNFSGTAANEADYSKTSNSIVIPAASLSGTITITGKNDCYVEGDETIVVDISNVTNGTENGTQQVSTTITDDDFYPTITLSVNNSSIPENGGSSIVTATLSNTFCADITIYFNFSGSADHPNDYNYPTNSVSIPTGSLTGTVTIASANDYLVESDETVIVSVESTNIAGISTSVTPSTITINDDDSYSITVSPTSGLITTEDGGTATFTVVLNAITYNNVTINLTSSDLTEGTVSPSSLTFTGSDYFIPKTVTITGVNDAFVDGDVSYSIVTSTAVSDDSNFDGLNPADVSVTNIDNEIVVEECNFPLIATPNTVECPNSTNGTIDLSVPYPIQFSDPSYVDLGTSLMSNRSAFTLDGWIKVDLSTIGNRISLFGQNDVIEFGFSNSNTLYCWTASGGSVSTNAYPSDNAWHHIAAVGNGSTIILYIDGASVATGGSSTSNYGSNSTYTSKIGAGVWDPSGGNFPGQMIKVGFWNRALSGGEISNQASGFYQYSGSESGLLAGYNFYEGAGTTLGSSPSGTDGSFSGSPSWVDNYSYSWTKSGDAGFSATTQDLSGVGPGTYTVVVTNGSVGCSNTDSWTIDSQDTEAPAALCKNLSVNLDASGNATITPAQVNNGSSDNCTAAGSLALSLDISSFSCSDIGDHTVTLTVTDESGNSSTCTSTVSVNDSAAPTANCQDITVNLDASGDATITTSQINNGSTDNCTAAGNLELSLDKTTFTCSDLGSNTVTLTVTDGSGNSSTCTAVVTVSDATAPTAKCQDISVNLDASGDATITTSQINNGSTDNCTAAGSLELSLDKTTFTCSDLGSNTVTLTVTDGSGNSSTCTAVVTVSDATAPTANCKDISINLDASGNATITPAQINNGSTDNCTAAGSLSLSLNETTFSCANIGGNTVTLTVTDEKGNSSTCNATVTVVDNLEPTITCPGNITALSTDNPITIAQPTVSDNCQVASIVNDYNNTDNASGTYSLGTTTVHWTVTDNSGNTAECDMDVTVQSVCSISDVSFTPITCVGDNNATITISATGSGQIEYSIDGGASFQTNNIFTSISPGSYTIQISDASGCTETWADPIVICESNDFSVTSSVTDVSCFGNSDGAIDATLNSYLTKSIYFDGSDDYIALNQSYPSNSTISAMTVCAWVKCDPGGGGWSVLDFDRSEYFNVSLGGTNRSGNTIQFATNSNLGGGIDDMTGNIDVKDSQWHFIAAVYDGTDKYLYVDGVLDNQKSNPHNGQPLGSNLTRYGFIGDGSEASGFDGGRNKTYYKGWIANVDYWEKALSADEIKQRMHSTLSGAETNLFAYWGLEEGTGSSVDPGGTMFNNPTWTDDVPYTFSWTKQGDGSFSANTLDISGLSAGTYDLTVTFDGACVQTSSVAVAEPEEILISPTISPVTCNGSANGAIDITISGGTEPYTFEWSTLDGSGLVANDEDQTGLGAGTYDVTVTDNHGCTTNGSYTITILADDTAPSITCPADASLTCVRDIPAVTDPTDFSYAEFLSLGGGGSASDNCSAPENLRFSYMDVASTTSGCKVTRTFTVVDEAGLSETCQQIFTLTDSDAPIINSGNLLSPAFGYADENCLSTLTISEPSITDNCGFGTVNVEVVANQTVADFNYDSNAQTVTGDFPLGETVLTWSVSDECGNLATAVQSVQVLDNSPPAIICPGNQSEDATGTCQFVLPDYTTSATVSDNCTAESNITINQTPLPGTIYYDNAVVAISLNAKDEADNEATCSFNLSLTGLSLVQLTEITYDDGQSGVGTIGSGQKPFITSSHTYVVDASETNPGNYNYTWALLNSSGGDVTPTISFNNVNHTNATIPFPEGAISAGNNYTIQVLKENKATSCSDVLEFILTVQESDFNAGIINPPDNTCQDGSTGSTTVVFWDVDFSGGVEPYNFNFSILNGSEGCTGNVSNLFSSDAESIITSVNCDTNYNTVVTKTANEARVQIVFTFPNQTGVDKDFELNIQLASDNFKITKQTTYTDETDDVTLWGTPVISFD